MANLNPPIVTGFNKAVLIGESTLISDFFSVVDPDGDEIVEYSFLDADYSTDSGYLSLNGIQLAAGEFHTIAAEELANLRYVAGTVVGQEVIQIRASDGVFNSNTGIAIAYSVSENTTRPIFTAEDASSVANEFVKVSTFYSGYDPDGWPTVRYKFRDRNTRSNSGYFVLDGVRMASNNWFYVRAEDFDKLEYFTGTSKTRENLLGRMFDGEKWSLIAKSHFQTSRNSHRPEIKGKYIAKGASEEFQISELFEYSDRDGNTPKTYSFRDASSQSDSGFITIDGVVQPSGTWLTVDARNLHNVTFTTGSVNRLDNISIRVSDGRFDSYRRRAYVAVSTRPVVEPKPPLIFDGDESVQLVSIIDQSDDGPRNIRYRIYDASADPFGARFELDSDILAPEVVHVFEAEEMANVRLKSGDFTARRLDEVFVQTFNGVKWSVWRSLKVRTEPRMLDALANVEDTVINARNSWRQWIPGSANERLQITYSFQETPEPALGLFTQRLTNAERIQVRQLLQRVEEMIFVDFVEIADSFIDPLTTNQGGKIRIGHSGIDLAFEPNDTASAPWGGNILLSSIHIIDAMQIGTVAHSTFLRLLGSAMGLREANTNFQVFNPLLFKWPLSDFSDDQRQTVMSFNPNPDNLFGDNELTDVIVPVERDRFGIYDIYALNELYGKGPGSFGGDNVYGNTGDPTSLFDWTEKIQTVNEQLLVDTEGDDNAIRIQANTPGEIFPDITVTLVHLEEANLLEEVTVDGSSITVQLATDAASRIASSGFSVINAINGSAAASALVTASVAPGSTGAGLIGGAFKTKPLRLFHDKAVQTSIVGDTGGDDTIDVSEMFVSSVIDLTPGSYSSIGEIASGTGVGNVDFYPAVNNVGIAHDVIIENVIGGVSDEVIQGNFADNILIANAGDDVLMGGGGSDRLYGGPGDDTYRWKLTDQNESIDENFSGGTDVLELNSHWGMDDIAEDMTFMRSGNDLLIDLTFNGSLSQGVISIKDMDESLSRVEVLRLNYVSGDSVDIDMQSIFDAANSTAQTFQITEDTTAFGLIAAPV